MVRRCIAFVVLLAASATVATAQDGPVGVGIVLAPEAGIWSCPGSTPDAAFACARQKCKAEGSDECYRDNWCYPAGWGALYSQRTADFHGPNSLCGAPSREEALATVKRWCESQEYVVSCYVATIIDPDGKEIDVDEEFNFDR